MNEGSWPEEGELVVCTVTQVKDFVAFVQLDEYGGREGLIPISEIATGWIKYIRDHISEGQKIVCKVLHVDPERGHIDLSKKDVNDHQRSEKIREWKSEQKARMWIGFASETSGVPESEIVTALLKEYSLLYEAFEDLVIDEKGFRSRVSLPEKALEAVVAVGRENVKIPRVTVTGVLTLTSPRPDGVNVIRRALRSAEPKIEGVDVELYYIGAPKYGIKITAPDYKTAQKAIEKAAASAIGVMERSGGEAKFARKQKSGKTA
ncbi:MAG TPA: translation initiation factor IF-2 subunit alpha [Methanoregulaceae archaeon]|nr:translation initiation factor IF-2 subunit alpha [Methanoregulaceae archaeon]HOV66729.1 translation initiation factor IF-2 subunit alpha [Methanoregulaceae archaeon]HQJ88883.1 translation initiation factor IF-2 subunit alpha [Methanoregulaceae archaeon]